jgi:hypothetical protein
MATGTLQRYKSQIYEAQDVPGKIRAVADQWKAAVCSLAAVHLFGSILDREPAVRRLSA